MFHEYLPAVSLSSQACVRESIWINFPIPKITISRLIVIGKSWTALSDSNSLKYDANS